MIVAVYTPTREGATALNVRTAPDPSAEVAGALAPGEPAEVLAVRRGWCELAGGGWADARFLDVEEAAAAERVETEAPEAPAEAPADADAADGEAPDALHGMTVAQLKELAEKSGVKLKKDMRKDEIIAAVLEGEND